MPEAGTPPALDLVEAARLYQTLYWVARTAAAPTPDTDVLHVTAAGWSAIPAVVHKALHGTPMVLTEHGVYVREAYLAAARNGDSPGTRFATTRLARGLARVAYEAADVVAPVTDANAHWEMGLGIDPAKILVLHNGLRPPAEPTPRAARRGPWSRSGASTRSRTSTPCCGSRPRRWPSSPTRASSTTARCPAGRRPTAARAWRCTTASG